MNLLSAGRCALSAAIGCLTLGVPSPAGQFKPETARAFDCYVQAAEAHMEARKTFLAAEPDAKNVQSLTPNGANPHKVAGGQIYDWIATVLIPGAKLDRLVQMLQDYGHRPRYFPETISSSRLLCRTGKDRFRYTMRLKEPAVIDVESDVVWEQVGPLRWSVRSYSTSTQEVGKDHGYLRRLYSYWRLEETEQGVAVEGETITLSEEFGSVARAFGSAFLGINPEKSLKRSLSEMRDSMLKPGLQISELPEGLPECGEPLHPGACAEK
jgi:hypothetical protein